MQADDIKAVVEAAVENSQVEVAIDGNHINLIVVSPVFEGLSPVKKQQLVYASLQDAIASGAIHAVHMKTYTPAQWAAQS